MSDTLPIVDLAPVLAGAADGDAIVARTLDGALRTWGAFTLVGHGVPQSALEGALLAAQSFFAQPLESRLTIRVNSHNRGYVPIHQSVYEGNLPDLKESFNLGLPLPADDPDVMAGKPLHGVNVWPDLPGYRHAVETFFTQMMTLGDRLLGPLALCLDMTPTALRAHYDKPIAFMRLFHYPPNSRVAEGEHGAAEHQDYGFLTFLAQDTLGGLQVRAPGGGIVDVTPRLDTFTVNVGDMLARLTGNAFRSAPHKVVNTAGVGRYSIPFFYDPSFDARFSGMTDMSAGQFLLSKFDKIYAYRKDLAASS